MSTAKAVRCAIYTRKSSDEGLEQDFNSLDAQREACSAYIRSQASEGWCELPDRYDDGGLSGGTLDRPGLQRLLADVAAGRIDIVVVYKVDRLSRSLLDFAKLVETFEKAQASFVSITQAFNTTSSMGRLTLNMLLSFAQFEREVTAERIRDKIAASKAKGMWMGGVPPLGYRPDGRSLAIVEEHAELVRHVFARYLALGNVRSLEAELKAQGISAPLRRTASGKPIGGKPFSRGSLYLMLRRVTYIGRIAHGEKVYPGTHEAIIDEQSFAAVQAMLVANRQGDGSPAPRSPRVSLLAGKIVDAQGLPLVATHATRTTPGKPGSALRYRYYVSRAMHHGAADAAPGTGMRLPAREIERLVATRIAAMFDDPVALIATAWLEVGPDQLVVFQAAAAALGADLRRLQADPLAVLLREVRVEHGHVLITLETAALARLLGVRCHPDAPSVLTLSVEGRLTRSGRALRLVQDNGSTCDASVDASLVRNIVTARRWWSELRRGELDVTRLAAREKVSPAYLTRIVRLAFLSPEVTQAILAGRQRAGVTTKTLTLDGPVPASWKQQAAVMLPEARSR